MQLVHQNAKKFFKVAVRSDSSGHAHERFVPHGKSRCCEDLQVAVHSGHHQIRQISVHLMPARAQLIHVAEGEKEAFVPVIALRVGRGSLGSVRSTSELRPLAFSDCTHELIFRTPVCLLYLTGRVHTQVEEEEAHRCQLFNDQFQ